MAQRRYLVTGGKGFVGAALVRHLVERGDWVRVFDNDTRGSQSRIAPVCDVVDLVRGDMRDAAAVDAAVEGMDAVCHLAYVNGTEFFYDRPDVVLDVGVKGMVNVIDACLKHGVRELMLASSSEVYQTPQRIPTDETAPLVVPNPANPRYSYGGGKIISELMAINYGRRYFDRVLIIRPHNVYGPDMGWEHVLPHFVMRMRDLCRTQPRGTLQFPIQGTGQETRSFVFIDDAVNGMALVMDKGEHLGIYNVGTEEEVTIAHVASLVGQFFDREIIVVPGDLLEGGTPRRCPDIGRAAALGYRPTVSLEDGLPVLAAWYDANAHLAPSVQA